MKITKTNPNIFSFLLMFAASFFLTAGAALAQSEVGVQKQVDKDADALESNNCAPARTFTFGSATQKFAFCITDHGNIQKLESPAGYIHIKYREGYALCRGANTSSFDAGIAEDGWGLPVISQPGGPRTFPLAITRQTNDGKLELEQSFDWNKTEREIFVTMTVKNISGTPVTGVQLVRYFDGDIDNSGLFDVYDRTSDTLWARSNDGYPTHGLTLTNLTLNLIHSVYIERIQDWEPYGGNGLRTATGCFPVNPLLVASAPYDYIGRLTYKLNTLPVGATRTVKMLYRRV